MQSERLKYNVALGFAATLQLPVQQIFGHVSRGKKQYWKKRIKQGICKQGHGGRRYTKFSDVQRLEIESQMFHYIAQQEGAVSRSDIQEWATTTLGIDLKLSMITSIIKSWGFSFHKAERIQYAKFSSANIDAYANYLVWIPTVDESRLKFLDESHIEARDLCRSRLLGPKNETIKLRTKVPLRETYSLTLMTSVGNTTSPVYAELRVGSNDQFDFANFLIASLRDGFLQENDILVCDNAQVHVATDSFEVIDDILQTFNIQLVYLPAYSPELNPCELVFAKMKNWIRAHREEEKSLWVELVQGLSTIDFPMMYAWYHHCKEP